MNTTKCGIIKNVY